MLSKSFAHTFSMMFALRREWIATNPAHAEPSVILPQWVQERHRLTHWDPNADQIEFPLSVNNTHSSSLLSLLQRSFSSSVSRRSSSLNSSAYDSRTARAAEGGAVLRTMSWDVNPMPTSGVCSAFQHHSFPISKSDESGDFLQNTAVKLTEKNNSRCFTPSTLGISSRHETPASTLAIPRNQEQSPNAHIELPRHISARLFAPQDGTVIRILDH
jgi:hypothetical protein